MAARPMGEQGVGHLMAGNVGHLVESGFDPISVGEDRRVELVQKALLKLPIGTTEIVCWISFASGDGRAL
jgi:hypothetical protein